MKDVYNSHTTVVSSSNSYFTDVNDGGCCLTFTMGCDL